MPIQNMCAVAQCHILCNHQLPVTCYGAKSTSLHGSSWRCLSGHLLHACRDMKPNNMQKLSWHVAWLQFVACMQRFADKHLFSTCMQSSNIPTCGDMMLKSQHLLLCHVCRLSCWLLTPCLHSYNHKKSGWRLRLLKQCNCQQHKALQTLNPANMPPCIHTIVQAYNPAIMQFCVH